MVTCGLYYMLHIVTERLELVELSAHNAAFIVALLNSPGWLRFIGDKRVHTPDDAIGYLVNGPMKSYHQYNFGLLLLKLRESNTPIGICGLLQRDYLPYPDIGFAVLPEYEGMGYAFEAAHSVLRHAAGAGIPLVGAILTPDNTRSVKLLSRLGFISAGKVTPPGSTGELVMMECRLQP